MGLDLEWAWVSAWQEVTGRSAMAVVPYAKGLMAGTVGGTVLFATYRVWRSRMIHDTGTLSGLLLFVLLPFVAFNIVLLYALPAIWRLGKDQVVWRYVLGILPAMSGMSTSFMRFEAVAFPLFLALATFFAKPGRGWALASALTVSLALHIWLLWRFVNFQWAG